MFCGSCLHDNALAKALGREGWDVQLVPLYTPIRTDEQDTSVDQVFFGGINVFLQQKIPVLRWLPRFLDRFLDQPWLIRRATRRAVETNPQMLGELATSMLRGMAGRQRKEVKRLVDWLVTSAKPDLLILTNLLVAGFVPEFKRRSRIPTLVTLQGDDVFTEQLIAPYRQQVLDLMHQVGQQVDGFIVHSSAYADRMAEYFRLPRSKMLITPLGIDTHDFLSLPGVTDRSNNESRRIGYLARLAPEKGLDVLVDTFIRLKQSPEFADVHLEIAGWLSPENRDFVQLQWEKLAAAGLQSFYRYWGVVERAAKLDFLKSIDLFCVPCRQHEPKGLFALEAMAAGLPVVLPDHGAFPEMIIAPTNAVLFRHGDLDDLLSQWQNLLRDRARRESLGRYARAYVSTHRNAQSMARDTQSKLKPFL